MPILLIAGLALLVFFLFFRKKSNSVDLTDVFVGGNTDNGLPNSGYGTPTITMAKVKSLTEALFHEMGLTYFTSEKKLLDLLSPLNEADFILLYNEFGIRPYDRFFNASDGLGLGQDYNLVEWLTYEVTSTSNKNKLKSLFPNFF